MTDTELKDVDILEFPRYLPVRNFRQEQSHYILEVGAGLKFYRLSLDSKALKTLSYFFNPHSPKEVSLKSGIPLDSVLQLCNQCTKLELLIKHVEVPEKFKRYDRNLLYYSLNSLNSVEAQAKLSTLSVALIGMGGIGNWVSLNLIGLGLKKLRLIDGDHIEKSNLCRQVLFSEANVGAKKVKIAQKELQARNSSTQVEEFEEAIKEENIESLIDGMDFVVLSADSPVHLIQKWVNQACVKKGIPFFTVGYSDGWGVIGPLVVPGKTTCLACSNFFESNNVFLQEANQDNIFLKELYRRYQAPSFTCLNSYVSSIAAYEIVKYFLDFGSCISLGTRIYVNSKDFQFEKKAYNLNPNCRVCAV